MLLVVLVASKEWVTEEGAEKFILTVKQMMHGMGEGFNGDSEYIVVDECFDPASVDEMKKIIRYAKNHKGFNKVASLGFYTIRLGFRVFTSCETTTFVYDVLSICFVQTCSAWGLMVNASINIKQVALMLGQSI